MTGLVSIGMMVSGAGGRYEPDPMANRETLEFVRAYYKIEDVEIRRQVYEMIKAMGPAGV